MSSLAQHKFSAYLRLIRWHQPIGTILLVWPAIWALLLANEGRVELTQLTLIVICAWLARSAGCALNDYADRNFDGQVDRTSTRPLATGELPARHALYIAAGFLSLAFALSFLLPYPAWPLLPPTVLLIALYPYAKRFFMLPQLVLAVTFSMAVPITWYASVGSFAPECFLLMAMTIIWVFGYDTIYSLSDREDDLRLGIHSSSIFFAGYTKHIIALFHLLFLLAFGLLGTYLAIDWRYWLALCLVVLSILYQNSLIHKKDQPEYQKAFRHNGLLGLCVSVALIDF